MATNALCPDCGTGIPADAPEGLCPRCLAGLAAQAQTDTGAGSIPTLVPGLPELARLFPEYSVINRIGLGGMGVVYRVRQGELDRFAALKILHPALACDPGFQARFRNEARSLAALNHPNIVTIYDFGERGGLFYLLMEYVDGGDLRHVSAAGTLALREVLAIVRQICDAVEFAHDQGVVHRDLKPGNILLDRRGHAKVADFGVAKLVGATDTGVPGGYIVGTPAYMAPEQRRGSTEVDQRADIYSLGAVFYELLTGKPPGERVEPPSARRIDVDGRLDRVVLRTLEVAPNLRYQRVGDLRTGVEHATRPRRGPLRLFAFAAAAVTLAAVAAVSWVGVRNLRSSQPDPPARESLSGSDTTGAGARALPIYADPGVRDGRDAGQGSPSPQEGGRGGESALQYPDPVTDPVEREQRPRVASAPSSAIVEYGRNVWQHAATGPAVRINLGTIAPRGSTYHRALQAMAVGWKQASQGRVRVVVYPDGTMGGDSEMVWLMRDKTLHAALLTAHGLSDIEPTVSGLQSMPLRFRDLEEFDHVNAQLRPVIQARLAEKNFVVLCWADAGWVRYFSKAPILAPDDLKTRKVFAWEGNPEQVNMMRDLGVNAIPLDTGDITTGLRTGLIDVVAMPPVFALAGRIDQQAPHMLDLNWAPLVGAIVIHRDAWLQIPEEFRPAMMEVAEQAGSQMRSGSRQESVEAVAAMQKRGLTVHSVTPAIQASWETMAESDLLPRIRGTLVSADVFDAVSRIIAEYRAEDGAGRDAE